MSLTYNGTEINQTTGSITYNGNEVKEVTLDGVSVWKKVTEVTKSKTLYSGKREGYNPSEYTLYDNVQSLNEIELTFWVVDASHNVDVVNSKTFTTSDIGSTYYKSIPVDTGEYGVYSFRFKLTLSNNTLKLVNITLYTTGGFSSSTNIKLLAKTTYTPTS